MELFWCRFAKSDRLLENLPADQCEVELETCLEWIKCENLNRFNELLISGHIAYSELDRRINLSAFLVATCIILRSVGFSDFKINVSI